MGEVRLPASPKLLDEIAGVMLVYSCIDILFESNLVTASQP